ncbi:MAG: hypothetical protein KC776_03695 [Myxococcales bacterium]|nr:hypothetical protein [Myxococcales bacterium]MCB9579482.1 hypothetical protein [Polyangiaceae bacterium]
MRVDELFFLSVAIVLRWRLYRPFFRWLRSDRVRMDEGGLRVRRFGLWRTYLPFEKVSGWKIHGATLCILGLDGRIELRWRFDNANRMLSTVSELEARLAAHQADGMPAFERGERSTRQWLADLERKARRSAESPYRSRVLLEDAARAVNEPTLSADTRAGAAAVLIASGEHGARRRIADSLGAEAPPLLVAVAARGGEPVAEDARDALGYLTGDERRALGR